MRALPLLLCFTLIACPPALRRPESSQLVVTGTLVAGGFSTRGELLSNARVRLLRADTGAELASNVSSSAGGYRLSVTVPAKTRVVMVAEADGFAPIARAFTAGPFTELTISAALSPLEPFDCVDTLCDAPLVDLSWAEPPASASGIATSFGQENPLLVDVDATQPLVLALGYAALDGGTSGSLRLRVPLQNQRSLVDALPGTGAIEVAAASFDPKLGLWTKLPPVALQAENGLPIAEGDLGTLQRNEYQGGAVAVLPVLSSTFVAVLGPGPTLGCLTGTLRAEGQSAEGATVGLRGAELVSALSDGSFCITGRVGTEKVPTSGQYGGLPYALGGVQAPTSAGACGGTCANVGTLTVLPEAVQLTAMCQFSGRVVDPQGNPVPDAEVVALDENVTGNSVIAFCGRTHNRCTQAAASGADGSFSLDVPLLSAVFVGARVSTTTSTGQAQWSGGQRFESCPNEPLTLKFDHGLERVEVSASFIGDQLSWVPPRVASRVTVLDGAGLPKWGLVAARGLVPPLTFGVVPSGTVETQAPTGAPASGDSVVVEFQGLSREGVVFGGSGSGTRP